MARAFNGTNQYLQTANGVITATPFTYACWVLLNSTAASQRILTSGTGAFATTQSLFFQVSNTSIEYTVDGSSVAISNATPSTGVWIHIAGVTTTAPLSTLYVNGVAQTTTTGATPSFSNANITVSANPAGNNLFVNGSVADAAIWSAALSAGEVLGLSQGMRPNTIRGKSLVFWCPIDGLVSAEPDFSGSAFNMTLFNSPTAASGPPIALFTPRWPRNFEPMIVTSTVFRKTLSQIGGRVGTRQQIGWGM